MGVDKDNASRRFAGVLKAGLGAAASSMASGQGPMAALGFAAIAATVEGGMGEFAHRFLSVRERDRVTRIGELISQYVDEQRAWGREPRADGFFEGKPGERSIAEELTEGVLLTAQRQYQEKKLPYIAYLYGNFAFSDISAGYANHLVHLADRLSYRQLCLLALFAAHEHLPLRDADYREDLTQAKELWSIIGEIKDLDDRGLVSSGAALLGYTDVAPGKMRIQGPGIVLYEHMNLSRMSVDELEPLAAQLK